MHVYMCILIYICLYMYAKDIVRKLLVVDSTARFLVQVRTYISIVSIFV